MVIETEEIKANYDNLYQILSSRYEEINGYDFYNYIFPNNEVAGELNTDYSKPNAIYLYTDKADKSTDRNLRRRIMLKDTWEDDYINFVEQNEKALCSGLAFRGRVNRLEHAQQMNALIFDLDAVTENEIMNLFLRFSKENGYRRMPIPTFIVMSGTGLHIYYVFDEPVELFPNIKIQMKSLKHDLTFKIWDYKGTTQDKNIQYQPLNQGFRMVGSCNDKYGTDVKAFKVGDKISLAHLNEFVIEEKNRVDIKQRFSPSKYTLAEAKEKFPDWYRKVVIEGDKTPRRWNIKRDLYDWWKRQYEKITGGHRYYFMMCMAIYAVKCDISRDELKADMYDMFEKLKVIEHTNALEEGDIIAALEAYDRSYFNFTIKDIEKLTNIRIERNKRNYRAQTTHLKLARANKKVLKEIGEMNPEGRPPKRDEVIAFLKENEDMNVTEISRALKVSRTTVYKYKKELKNEN